MQPKEIIEELGKSPEFKSWREEHKNFHLAHFFKDCSKEEIEVGYTNNDILAIFTLSSRGIRFSEEDEILKEDNLKINMLDIAKVKLDFEQAIEIARKINKEKYNNIQSIKEIVILQNIEAGQVYNITFITNSFETINIKIDAETGKVLKEEKVSFLTKLN